MGKPSEQRQLVPSGALAGPAALRRLSVCGDLAGAGAQAAAPVPRKNRLGGGESETARSPFDRKNCGNPLGLESSAI